MESQALPAHFHSAKALLTHVRDQRIAALMARFPPWYVRFHDGWSAPLTLLVAIAWFVALLPWLVRGWPPSYRLSAAILGLVYAARGFVVLASALIAYAGYRARRFPQARIDREVATTEQRAAAYAKAIDPRLVRIEALALLRRFLEGERATLLPEAAVGFRDPAQPTGVRVSLVEEAAERAEALERFPESSFRVDLAGLGIVDEYLPGGPEACEDGRTAHFTYTYDTDIAPRLRAAFAR